MKPMNCRDVIMRIGYVPLELNEGQKKMQGGDDKFGRHWKP